MRPLPHTMDEMWAENDAAWRVGFRAWVMWLGCVMLGAVLSSVWAPLGGAVIALGFVAVGYAGWRITVYSRRQRKFLRGRRRP